MMTRYLMQRADEEMGLDRCYGTIQIFCVIIFVFPNVYQYLYLVFVLFLSSISFFDVDIHACILNDDDICCWIRIQLLHDTGDCFSFVDINLHVSCVDIGFEINSIVQCHLHFYFKEYCTILFLLLDCLI